MTPFTVFPFIQIGFSRAGDRGVPVVVNALEVAAFMYPDAGVPGVPTLEHAVLMKNGQLIAFDPIGDNGDIGQIVEVVAKTVAASLGEPFADPL